MNTTNLKTLANLSQDEKEAFAAIEIAMMRREWKARDIALVDAELEILFMNISISVASPE